MACGIGICMTCVLPVEGEDGSISMLRSCIDGPVMDGSLVSWNQVGKSL
jgi:dihydroorotate dehydrogenase electron transfer subunit